MVRMRSSRGLGSSGLAKLAFQQYEVLTYRWDNDEAAATVAKLPAMSRDERTKALQVLADLGRSRKGALLMLEREVFVTLSGLLERAAAEPETAGKDDILCATLVGELCEHAEAVEFAVAVGMIESLVRLARLSFEMDAHSMFTRDLVDLSQTALTNLSTFKSAQKELRRRGALDTAVRLATRESPIPVRKRAIATVLNLSSNKDCVRRLVDCGGLEAAVAATRDFDGNPQFMALATIKNVNDVLPVAEMLIDNGILRLCTEVYAQSSNVQPETRLLSLFLIREFCKDEKLVPSIIEFGTLDLCRAVISDFERPIKDRILCLRAVDEVSSHGPKKGALKALADLDLVDLTARVANTYRFAEFTSDEAQARSVAYSILYNFTADERIAAKMLWYDSVSEACKDSVPDSVTEIRHDALLVLQGLSTHYRNQAVMLDMGVVEICVHVLSMDKAVVLLGSLAALDCLRNLAMHRSNRGPMREMGVLDLLSSILEQNCSREVRALVGEINSYLLGEALCCAIM